MRPGRVRLRYATRNVRKDERRTVSLETRAVLVRHPKLILRSDSQRTDLLSPTLTQSYLVAFLLELLDLGHYIEVTAVRSDHGDDSDLGEHCHANGYCADVWFNNSAQRGDYLSAADSRFVSALFDARHSNYLYQIGLAGSANNAGNRLAAGPTMFIDDGADHVHLGAL